MQVFTCETCQAELEVNGEVSTTIECGRCGNIVSTLAKDRTRQKQPVAEPVQFVALTGKQFRQIRYALVTMVGFFLVMPSLTLASGSARSTFLELMALPGYPILILGAIVFFVSFFKQD